MLRCPKCNFGFEQKPENAEEWFRCPGCHETLKFVLYSRTLFAGLIGAAAVVTFMATSIFLDKYKLPGSLIHLIAVGSASAIASGLGAFFWKARLGRIEQYDPYSALQLRR
jgi:hypothetical protein